MSADDFTKIRVKDDVTGIIGLAGALEETASSREDFMDSDEIGKYGIVRAPPLVINETIVTSGERK